MNGTHLGDKGARVGNPPTVPAYDNFEFLDKLLMPFLYSVIIFFLNIEFELQSAIRNIDKVCVS